MDWDLERLLRELCSIEGIADGDRVIEARALDVDGTRVLFDMSDDGEELVLTYLLEWPDEERIPAANLLVEMAYHGFEHALDSPALGFAAARGTDDLLACVRLRVDEVDTARHLADAVSSWEAAVQRRFGALCEAAVTDGEEDIEPGDDDADDTGEGTAGRGAAMSRQDSTASRAGLFTISV